MMNHAGRTRYRHAQREFSRFVHCAEHELRRHLEAAERGKELELAYSVYVSPDYVGRDGRPYSKFPSTLGISCGVAPIGRLTPEGGLASEGNLSLGYSLGPTGHVAIFLYPFTSEVSRPFEKIILLGHVPCDRARLFKRMDRDIKDMIAYGHETALDGEPTWRESLRIWWLRFTKKTYVEDKFEDKLIPPKTSNLLAKALAAIGKVALSAVFKLLTPFFLGVIATLLALK